MERHNLLNEIQGFDTMKLKTPNTIRVRPCVFVRWAEAMTAEEEGCYYNKEGTPCDMRFGWCNDCDMIIEYKGEQFMKFNRGDEVMTKCGSCGEEKQEELKTQGWVGKEMCAWEEEITDEELYSFIECK